MTALVARSLVLVASLITVAAGLLAAPATSASQQAAATSGWRTISAGVQHSCGIRTTGRLYCWGNNGFGRLGNGSSDASDVPVEVAGDRTDWRSVSTGGFHTCAVRTTGRLYCWGFGLSGAIGAGGGGTAFEPLEVTGERTDWASVTAGQDHTCALRTNGRLYCWGYNRYGQVGDGTERDRYQPRLVLGDRTDWTQVSAGVSHTCARRAVGRLYCWGYGGDGQLGRGGEGDRSAPTQVAGDRTDWASAAAAYYHSCARRTTGRLFCWGDNGNGQLGTGTTGDPALTPVEVAGARTDWVGLSAGMTHSCARRTSGRLFCWGYNASGQVGNRSTDDAHSPTLVSGRRTDWRGFSGGGAHTCAVTSTKEAFCWGDNSAGQLGDDTMKQRLAPTAVSWSPT